MSTEPNAKPFFQEWLEKLQQESWQLELIVSGIVIFGLFSGIDFLQVNEHKIRSFTDSTTVSGELLFAGTMTIWASMYISVTNLIVHILIRSLWIGAIGLRYVSGNIDYDSLNYAPNIIAYYQKKIGSFDDYIEKLENFSSIIFSYTFLLIFIVLSLLIFGFFAVGYINLVESFTAKLGGWGSNVEGILILTFLLLSLLVALDFLTLGLLKRIKNKRFSAFYLVVYRFYSTITLSFLWRPMLLNFLDKKFTRRLFILAVPYLIILLSIYQTEFVAVPYYPNLNNTDKIYMGNAANQFAFNHYYYDDERVKPGRGIRRKGVIQQFSLPSKRLSGSLGEVFIKGLPRDQYLLQGQDSTLFSLEPEGVRNIFQEFKEGFTEGTTKYKGSYEERATPYQENFKKIRAILEKAVLLKIDGQPIDPNRITCDFYNHWDENTKGLLCLFPLDSLSTGRHYLTVGRVKTKRKRVSPLDTTYYTIPFIYERRSGYEAR
ncbi:MAG: hypothetical protein AAF960_11600 [Bacteroidota bacterium]